MQSQVRLGYRSISGFDIKPSVAVSMRGRPGTSVFYIPMIPGEEKKRMVWGIPVDEETVAEKSLLKNGNAGSFHMLIAALTHAGLWPEKMQKFREKTE